MRSTTCTHQNAFSDMRSSARVPLCVPLDAFHDMRSTICVPLYASLYVVSRVCLSPALRGAVNGQPEFSLYASPTLRLRSVYVPSTFRLRSSNVPSTFRQSSDFKLSLLCRCSFSSLLH